MRRAFQPRRCAVLGLLALALIGCAAKETTPELREIGAVGAQLSVSDCPAGYTIIEGTNAADTLTGTEGSDCLVGLGGSDTLIGLGGDDFLIGGNGADVVQGGPGNDILHGEGGTDRLEGGDGNDTLDGGGNPDLLYGEAGSDVLLGAAGSDTLEGGIGADLLIGGDGDDILRGGDDDDRLLGGVGADDLYGDGGHDVIHGGGHADEAWGGDGDDVIDGGDGSDVLSGDAGDDALLGGLGTNSVDGGAGTDACSGTSCEKAALIASGCTNDAQCSGGARCIEDVGLCLLCVSDQDGDALCDSLDGCPADATKGGPGVCGCGVVDTDSDGDGAADCNDGCANDPTKTAPGICGCGVSDADSDADGSVDCNDGCPADPAKTAPGICGCGVSDADSDADGSVDCNDGCANDPVKTAPGLCGCGVSDADADSDSVPDCQDVCAGYPDTQDSDGDLVPDGCDVPTECTSMTVGLGVHSGNAYVSSAADIAALSGVSCITGSLMIFSPELPNLLGLEDLTDVAGAVIISDSPSLVELTGLENLTTVGAALSIGRNTQLNSLAALNNLTSVNQTPGPWPSSTPLAVHDNANLPACWVWKLEGQTGLNCTAYNYGDASPTDCRGNTGQGSCGTLPLGFACVSGATGPGVFDGDLMITDYPGISTPDLGGLTCVTGNFGVRFRSDFTDLALLSSLQAVGGSLSIEDNSALTSLYGLENLSTVGGSVAIANNPQLQSTSALNNLTSVNQTPGPWPSSTPLAVHDNATLPACWVWKLEAQTGLNCTAYNYGDASPTDCRGNTGQGSCGALPLGFACVPGAIGPGVFDGDLMITDYPGISTPDLGGLTCVTGNFGVRFRSDFTDLALFSSLQAVGGSLSIEDNSALTSLNGLENLSSVGGSVAIANNPQLQSTSALNNLTSVNQTPGPWPSSTPLAVHDNAILPACWVWKLEAQTGLNCTAYNYGDASPTDCRGNTGQGSCGTLPLGFECVAGATGPGVYTGDIAIYPGATLQLSDFGGLACVIGSLSIYQQAELSDLSAIPSLQGISGSLDIGMNTALTSLSGLEPLTTVGNALRIWGNAQLQSLAGLSNLSSLNQGASPASVGLEVHDNAALPACWLSQIETQTGVSCGAMTTPCDGNSGAGSCTP